VRAAPSLRVRLFAGAALWIVAALVGAWAMLSSLLEGHLQGQAVQRLEAHLDELIAALDLDSPDLLRLEVDLSDPLFRRPLSGLYWQVSGPADEPLRSRSLWDTSLALPEPQRDGAVRNLELSGPNGQKLFGVERTILLRDPGRWLQLAVASDVAAVERVTGPAGRLLAVALAVIAIGLISAAALQVTAGLRPLRGLRDALGEVRRGEQSRLDGAYPTELAPVVDELNALLAHQGALVQRARTQAGNLAHGLKTPLAVIANEALDLRERALPEPSERLLTAVDSMRRLVDANLARSRMAAAPNLLGQRTSVEPVVERVARTLERLYAERTLRLEIDVEPGSVFSGEAEDLEELVGNLVDNACKWARGQVRIRVRHDERDLELEVEDDGTGLDESLLAAALRRGQRLDEATPGSGLGLAIVRELAELYGGSIALDRAGLGGLRARVLLPGAFESPQTKP
jgi:signal transduction histidine kinase